MTFPIVLGFRVPVSLFPAPVFFCVFTRRQLLLELRIGDLEPVLDSNRLTSLAVQKAELQRILRDLLGGSPHYCTIRTLSPTFPYARKLILWA